MGLWQSIWSYWKVRKKYWLLPMGLSLFVMGVLAVIILLLARQNDMSGMLYRLL
ncbi:hypothetical protein SAMN02745704_02418 [Paucidesulfovibrio gracilis DSM 16080]|uniref:Uncharacterized protein n=1 Tax=Paucidesulfovibrio gracilis DSM 16080 TaxID=1121449 RepID=A0A1T4XTY4_9BACT|nr:DUF5989 family protein [Paucidesulfovibrio gracilis]SKA92545.1 hypothetical protein SAMN02745704_02418 [Paucidesulfovibrio gracilis DSM 16080]